MTRWRPVLTPGRRRYLEEMADGKPHIMRERGPVGYSCRQLGWCSFAVRNVATGEVLPMRDAGPFYDEAGVRRLEFLTENWNGAQIITPEGMRVLGIS